MELLSLLLYGSINSSMVIYYLKKKGDFCNFPFWAGIISMGWFFPQALGGYFNSCMLPENSYWQAMLFASLCSFFLWAGYLRGFKQKLKPHTWLAANFNGKSLYYCGIALCVFGFFFEWKLLTLPEEILSQSQWSGIAVRYLFFAGAFKIGFLTIWLLYLNQQKWFMPSILFYLLPCFILLLAPAILHGRRAGMMDLVAYIVVALWLTRRIAFPRWFLVPGLIFGLMLINSIGIYRNLLNDKSLPLVERFGQVISIDYLAQTARITKESGPEFTNYVFLRKAVEETSSYDFGLRHWNMLIFNYVPAQIVGNRFKQSLMLDLPNGQTIAYQKFGHIPGRGTTLTGYFDAYASFGWFGFLKFYIIGWIMARLYKYAITNNFIGHLLYIFFLTSAMHAITHSTNQILIRSWIYFFMLGYPVLLLAKKISGVKKINIL